MGSALVDCKGLSMMVLTNACEYLMLCVFIDLHLYIKVYLLVLHINKVTFLVLHIIELFTLVVMYISNPNLN
jgi:hypothetical protein